MQFIISVFVICALFVLIHCGNSEKEENEHFSNDWLDILGLTRPKTIRNNPESTNTAGAEFLLDVVRFHKRNLHNKVKRSNLDIDLSENDESKIEQSNIIVTLENVINRNSRSGGNRMKLRFVMPKLKDIQKLISAELRLFQNKAINESIFIISVYEALKDSRQKKFEEHLDSNITGWFSEPSKDPKLRKIGEKLTSSDYTGWLSIDITSIFDSWLDVPRPIQSIYVTVSPYNDPESEMLPSTIGLQTMDSNQKQPFVVAFLKGNNQIRLPRSSVFGRRTPTFEELSQSNDQNEPCALKVLKVRIKELYKDWVIAPDVFEASLCVGRCKFPLALPIDATNHAIVQSLMAIKNPGKFPEPKCAPSSHMPMSLVVKEEQNHILRHYDDMIAVNCGCQ